MVLEQQKQDAVAIVYGNSEYPELFGKVFFRETLSGGVIVTAEILYLPKMNGFLGMHIHEIGDCTQPFDRTGNHYNPAGTEHPMHAGDLPPLLNNNGYAYLSFYDERFTIKDIIGRSVIIHSKRDDFTSQPSGDAGEKIGCGVIVSLV